MVGTGSWGTALAVLLSRKNLAVTLWARTPEEAQRLRENRDKRSLLPSGVLPENLTVAHSLREAFSDSKVVLLVVPSQTMRANVQRIREHLPADVVLVSAAKGLETHTCKRMSEVISEELPEAFGDKICALSGPNLAREIAAGQPAATVVAAADDRVAAYVQDMLISPTFRVYTSSDIVGVELGGALKNVIALGAGMGDGLGVGDNAKAAFITRGLAEMARLGAAAGANPLTFAGLAGLGDLIATCSSRLSRNRFVGEELAKGRTLQEVQSSMDMVAEGVPTTAATKELAHRYGVEMPIAEAMHEVLFSAKSPRGAIMELMTREPKGELQGIEEMFLKIQSSWPRK